MGERGNICVRQRDGEVWFYTHWYGNQTFKAVCNALAKRERWDDESYLARIIFDSLLALSPQRDETTGFGIGLYEMDPNYPPVYVDVGRKLVIKDGLQWTFQECAKMVNQQQVKHGG
jgi:hypothetical protein